MENDVWKSLVLIQKVGLAVLAIILVLQISTVVAFKHLPSPPYGGDFYRERGFAQYIANGNPFWTDPYFEGELEFYPPLGYLIPAGLSKLGFDLESTVYYLVIITMAAISYVFYLIGLKIFKSKSYATILALSYYVFEQFIALKFTANLGLLFFTLSFYWYILLREEKTLIRKVMFGIFIGLASLSHYRIFIQTIIVIGSILLVEAFMRIRKDGFIEVKKIAMDYIVPVVVAMIIASVFFAPLIARYSLKTLNETNKYSFVEPSGISTLVSLITSTFFNFAAVSYSVMSILVLIGIYIAATNLKNSKIALVFIAFVSVIIASGHYLLTRPLFDTWIVPGHIFGGIMFSRIFFFALGIKALHSLSKGYGFSRYIPVASLIFLILPLQVASYNVYSSSRWVKYGKEMDQSSSAIYDVRDWILENTGNDDVFIGNDESMFLINAISGRHVSSTRRTHASPYVDVEERYADTIVMLYGDDDAVRKALIQKYNVRYVFLDQFLVSNPMVVLSVHAGYLDENGVSFQIGDVPFDPAANEGLKYESAIVQPQELKILASATKVKDFYVGSSLFASIYRVII